MKDNQIISNISINSINLIIIIVIIIIILLLFIYFKKNQKIDAIVKEIWIYPIKSTKGIQLTNSKVGPMGLLYDRLFVIVDRNKRFISQRTHPKLALIETSFSKSKLLTIKIPNGKSVDIPLEEPPTPYEVHDISIWSDICEGIDMGDEVAKLINTYLGTGQEMRLMRIPDNYERKTDRVYSQDGRTGFADGFPFLFLSKGSVEQLLKCVKFPIQLNNETPLSALNFRPNLVFDECAPFAEDTWKEITIASNPNSNSNSNSKNKNNISFTIVKPCSRCKMPNVNPNTGEYLQDSNNSGESYYVSEALENFRTGDQLHFYPKGKENNETNPWGKKVFFGQNAEHKGKGTISVGDVVYVKKYQ